MTNKITVGIIDDHVIVRKGLTELLHNLGHFQVVQEHEHGQAFINSLNDNHTVPQVYLLDYSMPRVNGLEVLEHIKELGLEHKFVILTQHLEDNLKVQAYELGARGFLNKTCSAQELQNTLLKVVETGYDNFEEILRLMRNQNTIKDLTAQVKSTLTARELHLIELVCDEKEYTYQEIADHMNISVKTVDACRATLFQKVKAKSKVGLVLYSFKYRLTLPFHY